MALKFGSNQAQLIGILAAYASSAQMTKYWNAKTGKKNNLKPSNKLYGYKWIY